MMLDSATLTFLNEIRICGARLLQLEQPSPKVERAALTSGP
jgi:hypothetical protein